jgi:prepilin-type N-terminal cleavage/methylation domain-containing protein
MVKEFQHPKPFKAFGFFTNNRGMTLIELIVSISIVALISGTVLANFRSGERTNNLNVAAQKLASDIRQVQNYTMSLKEHNGTTPPGGWGVYFDKTGLNGDHYYVFADTDSDHLCHAPFAPCTDIDGDYYAYIDLPKGVKIEDLKSGNIPRDSLQASFEPPTPTVYLCYDEFCDSEGIEIILGSNGKTKTIVINKFGLIEVK